MGSVNVNALAGQPPPAALLVDVPALVTAYFARRPDPAQPAQRVAFGTSGHRGCALDGSFNEWHVLAISQAICEYRERHGITGPLFLGIDTHALSVPAGVTALEVFAANGVQVMLAAGAPYTPTPAVSHAILTYNRGRERALGDGVVITPSHNPPEDGGFKYNPPHGGPADQDVTAQIAARANELLGGIQAVRRMPYERALRAPTTHRYDYLNTYVADLDNVIDLAVVSAAGLRLGVDPLGGAGVHYWGAIAERYRLDLTVVSDVVDPTFRFMSLDWDGRIRMDPSSGHAMQRLIGLKDRFDIAFGCDTDHDRHGIVTRSAGLLASNHYMSAAIDYLFRHRPQWSAGAAVGKSVVSSQLIDRVAAALPRPLYEVPVGFKWYVGGLLDGTLGFGGEESAGAAFLRRDGRAWTTDKDGIVPCLLAAEMTAREGRDPGERYRALTQRLGDPVFERLDAPATAQQKQRLRQLTAQQVTSADLAGDAICSVLTRAPGNDAAIGGLKVASEQAWFAARPSGTEDLYKIYAESFRGPAHLVRVLEQAQAIVGACLSEAAQPPVVS